MEHSRQDGIATMPPDELLETILHLEYLRSIAGSVSDPLHLVVIDGVVKYLIKRLAEIATSTKHREPIHRHDGVILAFPEAAPLQGSSPPSRHPTHGVLDKSPP